MADEQSTKRGRGRPPLTGERMRRIHLSLPDTLLQHVEEQATGGKRSISHVVREALTEWLERHRGKDQ